MARLLVDVGFKGREALAKLQPSEQLFLERWFQLLHDETHPHWALRPLSLGNLAELYPQSPSAFDRQLFSALENEVVRRAAARAPDSVSINHPSSHVAAYRENPCATCRHVLAEAQSTATSRIENLIEQLLAAIEKSWTEEILLLTPVIAAEAVSLGVSSRFMLQACKNYVLDPREERKAKSFVDRLTGFLMHDVGQKPRSEQTPERGTCTLRREVQLEIPSRTMIPDKLGSDNVGWIELEQVGGKGSRRLWLTANNVVDQLKRREEAAAELRACTPPLIAVLRFIFPERSVRAFPFLVKVPTEGQPIECPGHRNILSHRKGHLGLSAMEVLIADERVRSALYWMSIAYEVWRESVTHAAAMVWMALESLLGKSDVERCADAYVTRLGNQVADDLEETLASMAGTSKARKKGKRRPPDWVLGMPLRSKAMSELAWLQELFAEAENTGGNSLFLEVVKDAQQLLTAPKRQAAVKEQVVIDLGILRATRHAIAHRGSAIIEEPVAHYLATLGCECIRALLAERLEGTQFEGILEGQPQILGRCTTQNNHSHNFMIPAWIKFTKNIAISSWMHKHRHMGDLTASQVAAIVAGGCVTVTSSTDEGHAHDVRFTRN